MRLILIAIAAVALIALIALPRVLQSEQDFERVEAPILLEERPDPTAANETLVADDRRGLAQADHPIATIRRRDARLRARRPREEGHYHSLHNDSHRSSLSSVRQRS